jgi:DNA-binding CsgD family transcriptional regulator
MAIPNVSPNALQFPLEAIRYLAESERIHRALNNPTGLALALARQGSLGLFDGDLTLAKARLDEAERLALELGDERILGRLAGIRVLRHVQEGDFTAARRHLEDAFQRGVNRGDHQLPTWLPILAAVLHWQGLDVWSARVFGLAEVLTATRQPRADEMMTTLGRLSGIGDIRAELRARLGDEAFDREVAAGKRLKLDDLWTIPHPPEPAPAAQAISASETSLTAREIEVLRLLAQDLGNLQIAERLVVSRRTVDAHLRSIYDKLGVKSRDAALRVAREQRLISNP